MDNVLKNDTYPEIANQICMDTLRVKKIYPSRSLRDWMDRHYRVMLLFINFIPISHSFLLLILL